MLTQKAPESTEALDLLTDVEVAKLAPIPVGTLRYWRHIGTGPRWFKLGPRRVVYRRADVLAWIEQEYNGGEATR